MPNHQSKILFLCLAVTLAIFVLLPTVAFATVVVLTTADTSPWTVPADWNNSDNSIEAIGGGGGGGSGATGDAEFGGGGGGAGGAGAYAKVTNLTLSGTVDFTIGAAGTGGASPTAGGLTQFKDSTTLKAAAGSVGAAATSTSGATGGAGGTVANSVGAAARTAGGTGGSGANESGGTGGGGGGGGGAGGPTAGNNGTTATTSTGKAGGKGDGTAGGAGGADSSGNGGAGTELGGSVGSGGGGGGGNGGNGGAAGSAGGTSGNYGAGGAAGGGGGGGVGARGAGKNGTAGVIIITYTPAGISISGTVYTDEGTTTMGSGRTVAVSVNGAAAAGTTTTGADGTYTISSITAAAGAILTLYLDGATEDGVTVSVSSGSNLTGINIYQNYLITRCDNSCSLSNTNLDTADNNADADISAIYSVSGGANTVASGKSLFIPVSHTYAPSGNVTVGGTWTNNGTYTTGTETVTLNGTSSYNFKPGSSIYNVTINGSGGTYTLQASLTVTNNLTITAGTLDTKSGSNYGITIGNNYSNSGTFTARSGTVTFNATATGKTITAGGSSFYDLTFNGVGGGWTLQDAATVSDVLTITAGTLSLGSQTLTLSGTTGTPLSNAGTFTASTGTVSYTGNNGAGNTTVANVTYYNLTLNNSLETYVLAAAATANNNLTITAGTLDTVSGQNYGLTVGGNWSNSGTFTARSGTVTLTSTSASATLTSGGSSFYNLTQNGSGGTYTLQDALSISNALTITAGTFDANNKNITAATFASSNTNTRVITMGSGTWTLSGTGTVWDISTATNLTLTATTSTIKITDTSNTANTFAGGGKTYGNIWFSRGASTASNTISGSNTFTDFKDDGSAAHSILFTNGTTTTVTTFTVSGTAGNLITINSDTTATHTLTKAGGGVISRDYLNIQHSVATPATTWYAGTHSTNNQSVATAGSGWIFTDAWTFDQKHFRFYRDNAGLNSADFYAAEDTNYNIGVGTTFRLRIEVANTGTGAGDITRRLEFKEDSGSWIQITTSTNNVRLSDSSNFTDGGATTSRLTAVGTFTAGQGKDTSSDTSSLSLTNAYNTEDEYSLILQSAAAGHAYQFRITNAGTALDTYTVTPAINTPDNTPPVPSGFNPATSATIKTATPNITYSLDEGGDCKASTTNASYASMSGADCTGDGSTGGSCLMPSLGSNGSKTIYFACQDIWGNQDTSSTTHSVTYTLTLSSGSTPSFMIKGSIKFKGSLIFR